MNKNTTFKIDGTEKVFSIENTPDFKFGPDQILSNESTDISFGQPWYEDGYSELDFLSTEEFDSLKNGLIASIDQIIHQEFPSLDLTGFNLENYHHYVKTDDDHLKIVTKTRDLFSQDFNFTIEKYLPKLENVLNFKLTDIDPFTNQKMHIIVRINRPFSKDYNPPHKDIYEGVDLSEYIPQFINFWIPIAGVTEKTNLPLAPKSHTINENLVLRTFEGGLIEGNKYRVRMIKSWNGDNALIRSKVKYGQVLIFSSHLIHGLATNEEIDKTRVALEFRLFKMEKAEIVTNLNSDNLKILKSYNNIYLYGASNTGRLCLNELQNNEINPDYFIDDTVFKIGKEFEGLKILSYEQFLIKGSQNEKNAIVISSTYAKVLVEKLKTLPNVDLFIMFDIIWRQNMLDFEKKYIQFTEYLNALNKSNLVADSISVYKAIQEYLKTGNSIHLYNIATSEECYFTNDVLEYFKGKELNIIDAGAHDGDLIRPIRKFNLNISKWHCFEPDPENFKKLLDTKESINFQDLMICYNFGLWDKEDELYFEVHDGGTNSKISTKSNSDIKICVKSIDSLFEDYEVNFIKMDIEGSELNALKGGLATIIKNRPVLAISIYHSIADFFSIYEFLNMNLMNYHFKIKQHSVTLGETVLYGIPF